MCERYTIAISECEMMNYGTTGSRDGSEMCDLTLEAFPRVVNYKQNGKIKRPSLGHLCGEYDVERSLTNLAEIPPSQDGETDAVSTFKLGWIQGVLIPCLLNIWGVMLFLRIPWIVAQSGVGQALAIVVVSTLVCALTTLSLSALCTNGEVKGGGIYFIISRSLGPEFGASVGVVLAFANAVSASLNTIGFCESFNDLLLSRYSVKLFQNAENSFRVVGIITIFVMILICATGIEWESKAQNLLIAVIVLAMLDFFCGTIVGPGEDTDKIAMGFVGIKWERFVENWYSNYTMADGKMQSFFSMFALFFPSVTGIQAGANISGDLKDPSSAIPKGTLLSLLISMISYMVTVIFAGAAATRYASGLPAETSNSTFENCSYRQCYFGLHNDYSIMQLMAVWSQLIYFGCFAATISTALTNLLTVPRLLQALGNDLIYPGVDFFAKGYGKNGEPYRGYVLTFFLSSAFVLAGNLNEIAPLISNFYLASYALINFCAFHAALVKPLGWRPTFKCYNMWLSLVSCLICLLTMFFIDWRTSLATFIVFFTLYLLVLYRKPDVNWGSSTQAHLYKWALTSSHRLTTVDEHVKNYQPHMLVLMDSPHCKPAHLQLAHLITKNSALLVCTYITNKKLSYKQRLNLLNEFTRNLVHWKVKGFPCIVDGLKLEDAVKGIMQSCGIGKLRPNILTMGYKENWHSNPIKGDVQSYFRVIQTALENRLAVVILRMPKSSIKGVVNEAFGDGEDEGDVEPERNSTVPSLSIFEERLKGGMVDVWWLYDDGGLTMLIPHILTARTDWRDCKLRIFTLTYNKQEIQREEQNMAALLTKFRIEYDSLKMLSIEREADSAYKELFLNLVGPFCQSNDDSGPLVREEELKLLEDKTNRHMRMKELLNEYSRSSSLIIMSLPVPRKEIVSAPVYMAWLELLTRDMPPFLLVRGNQTSVLTFYS